jgi:integrase
MGLEIQKKKDGSLKSNWWYGRFMINGKQHVMNLGVEVKGKVPKTLRTLGDTAFECSRTLAALKLKEMVREANSLKVAEKHLQELYELKSGGSLGQVPITDIDDQRFMTPARRGRSLDREKIHRIALQDFIRYMRENHGSVTYVSQVTKSMARGWLATLDLKKYSSVTYNDKLHILKGFFDRIGDEAGVMRNPFAGCPTRIKKIVHRQPFTQEELTNILNHCDELLRPVVLTAMCTAMRRGDCCRLKWESVDLEGGFVTVKTSKTGEVAEIPLFPLLRDELAHLPRTSKFVFPEAEEMCRTNNSGLTWRFQQALKAAKIENTAAPEKKTVRRSNLKDFHSFRTTWITMALSAGVPMELVRRVTGHSTVEVVLKHYFRPGKEAFKTALETAMPKMLTGGEKEEKKEIIETPKDALLQLVEQADKVSKESFVAQVAKIAHGMAA